jgi:hypothetical protein
VPERVFIAGGAGGVGASGDNILTSAGGAAAGSGIMGTLLSLLVAEKSGFPMAEQVSESELRAFTERVTRQAMESMQQAIGGGLVPTSEHHGNGAPTPEIAAAGAPNSRVEGLEIRTDGA